MQKKLSVQTTFLLLLAILFFAGFLRIYHFHDWLLFRGDQAREATLIAHAIKNGPENLPLLGPRATQVSGTGEYLRLGPAYYYILYLGVNLSRSIDPAAIAFPDLFFSILAIPMLFLLLRLYFRPIHALMLTALYAFSFVAVYYSRFAWNPNSVPFFIALNFFALLKFVQEKKYRRRLGWLALSLFAYSIAAQLHYLAFFTLTGTNFLFLAWHFRWWDIKRLRNIINLHGKETWSTIMLGTIVIAVLFTPLIANELASEFSNSRSFIKAFSTKPQHQPLIWKLVERVKQDSYHFSLISTGRSVETKSKPAPHLLGFLSIILGLGLLFQTYWREKSYSKKQFLMLFILSLTIFFIISTPIAFQLQPRYYSPVFFLPFVLIGLFFQFLEKKLKPKHSWIFISLIFILLVTSNLQSTFAYFHEQSLSQKKAFKTNRSVMLKNTDGITLGQMETAVDFIATDAKKPIIFWSKPEYMGPFNYLFSLKKNLPTPTYLDRVYNQQPFDTVYVLVPAFNAIQAVPDCLASIARPVDSFQSGQLVVVEYQLDPEQSRTFFKTKKKSVSTSTDRLYWRNILGQPGNTSHPIENEQPDESESDL